MENQNVAKGHKRYRGRVVYLYAFDLAYDMKREPLGQLMGQPMQDYSIGPSKRSPKQMLFYQPQMVKLPPERRQIAGRDVQIEQSVKLFNIGAISFQVSVPFDVDRIEELVGYHDLCFATGSLEDEVRQFAKKVRDELAPCCIRPVDQLGRSEDYTVFCLNELPETDKAQAARAEDWLIKNRRTVAGLLTQEDDAAHLSEQEAEESTGQYISYYNEDLVVVDWDAALIVGELDGLDDLLHIMELANVQLVELAAYDRILDASLEASYRDVGRWTARSRRGVRRNLREIRVDLARLSDELMNITKFFGDWHLARVYQSLSNRFHLTDWHRTINNKLKTLGDLYGILQQEHTNAAMVILEAAIVLLFIIDVILLLWGL